MAQLNLHSFIGACSDYESSRLHVMAALQQIRREFSQNRIYPSLASLIELYFTLRDIVRSSEGIRRELPKHLRGLDMEAKRLIFESMENDPAGIEAVDDLIQWSLPQIREAIEEGKTIYNFVDENLSIMQIGLLPSYLEEGYLLVPDVKHDRLHVLHYEVSIFSRAEEKFRNLKTIAVKTISVAGIVPTPTSIKQELIREHQDLPNPATYLFETDIDFPYSETILPVAKRKLLRRISS